MHFCSRTFANPNPKIMLDLNNVNHLEEAMTALSQR
jgi:hypothetical protein